MKVGKKTPLTLAHFGFGKDGDALGDDRLPTALLTEWQADEASAAHVFPSYARLLGQRGTRKGDSRYSWTVDFAARRATARADMQPLLEQAAAARADAVDSKEKLKSLKKTKDAGPEIRELISALEVRIREQERAAHDQEAQALTIDAAVFDLKAVNPHAVTVADERTPAQIIASIDAQGQIVADALDRLRTLL